MILASLIQVLVARLRAHRLYRTRLAELERMSDRDLADIGIGRDEICDIARG